MRRIALTAAVVTRESFAPFGVLPPFEGDGGPTADLEFRLGDGSVNYIGHAISEIDTHDGRFGCDHLNRHDTHTQTLMPMSCAAVMVVAPPEVDFSDPSHLDTVRAFVLPQHSCVHLRLGTWHWGPYPMGADHLRILNVQGRGWPDDNTVVHFARDHGVTYDVTSGSD